MNINWLTRGLVAVITGVGGFRDDDNKGTQSKNKLNEILYMYKKKFSLPTGKETDSK